MPMLVAPWLLTIMVVLGAVLLIVGIAGIVRDGRRISAPIYIVMGLGLFAVGAGIWLTEHDHPLLLTLVFAVTLGLLLLGNLVGYPLLVVLLLYSGVTILRRESRTLGNALALLAGIGLILLPVTLGLLAPPEAVHDNPGYLTRYAVHLTAVLIVAYLAFAFAAFIVASLLYRWRRSRTVPEAVIVLGSGLVHGQVPPLLAGRLERGLRSQIEYHGEPVIITSGGQGPDEHRPEGEAMRDYLLAHGADPAKVIAETESRTTEENLRLSRKLLTSPAAPVVVATSSYHVFRTALLTRTLGMRARVVGTPTAWYYFPSAVLREFLGVMRDHLHFNLLSVGVLLAFAVTFTLIIVPAMSPIDG